MDSYLSQLLDASGMESLASLERSMRPARAELLSSRKELARAVRDGAELAPREETAKLREDPDWRVALPPADLTYRLVELATPATAADAKAAMASGADVWIADLEDMMVPLPAQLLNAHQVISAVAATRTGNAEPGVPTLMVRPRGLHLPETHVQVDGEPASAALVDCVTFLARCGGELVANGTAPYLYLPKMETAAEAAWWNELFSKAEEALGLPRGCVRVSVLVETVQAMYELEEIVHALRERVTGLAAGRWDYVFSHLRTYGHRPEYLLPDREAFTMNTRFLRTYTDLIVRTCRRRGVQAIGGPIALAPAGPFDESVAMTHARVHRDKAREAAQGFDGAWVVHPGLVPVARAPFAERDQEHGSGARDRLEDPTLPRPEVTIDPESLRDVSALPGSSTLTGVRTAMRSALAYLTGWLAGRGTLTKSGHIEDFGTVELARMQLWQWLHHCERLAEGPTMSVRLLDRMLTEEITLARRRGAREDLLDRAVALLRNSVVTDDPPGFLCVQAYQELLQLSEVADTLNGAEGGAA